MKNIALTLSLILLISANVFSQGYKDYKSLKLGLKASPNIGWLRPETRNFENDGIRFGFSYGLISDFRLAENYYVGSGLFITHWGGKLLMPAIEDVNGVETNVTQRRIYNLQYLEIPLTLKLLTNEIGYSTYYGQFGIGVGANINAKGEDRFYNDSYVRVDESPDIKSDITFMRVALVIGAGMEYSLAKNASVLVGVEYNNGFTNLLKSKPEHTSKHSAVTNYFQLTIGIVF
jgi:opacity protein-like surface antigen